MKKKIISILCAAVLLFSLTGCNASNDNKLAQSKDLVVKNTARANVLAKATLDTYVNWAAYDADKNSKRWQFNVKGYNNPFEDKASNAPASVWHYTAVLGMNNRLAQINTIGTKQSKYYEEINDDAFSELSWYEGTAPVTNYNGTKETKFYGVNRSTTVRGRAAVAGKEAVYDDQMWLIRENIAAYNNTKNPIYLSEAERLSNICIDGWDTSLDENGFEYGGITWGPAYGSRHTCSNGPIIAPLVKIAEFYKDKEDKIGDVKKYDYYLNWAKKVYDFTYETLRNYDNTYADAFWTERDPIERAEEDGGMYYQTTRITNIDTTTYTYNSGSMISGAAELYRLTNENRYLTEARAAAEAADKNFSQATATPGLYILPNTSTVWFNLVLLTGFMELYPFAKEEVAPYIDKYDVALNYAYDNFLYKDFLPHNLAEGWTYGTNGKDAQKDVMDCAANAEMFAMIAQYHAMK